MDSGAYEAALAAHLERATPDPEWKALFRQSADRVLADLAGDERARLLQYMESFSVPSAAFIVRRMAAVHALALFRGEGAGSAQRLEQFRRDYTLPAPGEEEGKHTGDAPRQVFAAALRQRQGVDPEYGEFVAGCIGATMDSFAADARTDVEELFAGWPVEAVHFTFCTWMWLSDNAKRAKMAGAQYDQWKASGDERIWWRYFDV